MSRITIRAADRGGCSPYCRSSPAAAGQITLFPHSRSRASVTLMLFGIDAAGRVEPTIGPSGLQRHRGKHFPPPVSGASKSRAGDGHVLPQTWLGTRQDDARRNHNQAG